MNEQELKMLQEAFFPNPNISLGEIFKIIELEESRLDKFRLLFEGQEEFTFSMQSIPEIPISELGWSDLSTPDDAPGASSTSRGQLMNFLKNIQGDDLKQKIDSLNDFYSMDTALIDKLSLNDKAAGSRVSSVLSYLVFYKTLTSIITNFNASSAGFTFESFLAVLLGGRQVPTGEGTIADLYDANNTPISLKLYGEAKVEAGGSFKDLVNDLIKAPNYMQYVVCTKMLKTQEKIDPETKEVSIQKIKGQIASIKFYRFNFTLQNVFEILSKSSTDSRRSIILPAAYIADKTDVASTLPVGVQYPSAAEAHVDFKEIARATIEKLGDIGLGSFSYDELWNALDYSNAENEIWATKDDVAVHGRTQLGQTKVLKKIYAGERDELEGSLFSGVSRKVVVELAKALVIANEQLRSKYETKTAHLVRSAAINNAYFPKREDGTRASDDELIAASVAAYSALSDEEKMQALTQTLGYTGGKSARAGHFGLTGNMVKNLHKRESPIPEFAPAGNIEADLEDVTVKTSYVGEIKVGTEAIQRMLDQSISLINKDIFRIFDNLKTLTTSIKTYFAGGLQDAKSAESAILSADGIESKTREVSGVDPS